MKLQEKAIYIAVITAALMLLFVQGYQIIELFDRKEEQFESTLKTTMERIAVRHEKAENVRRFFKIANTNFNGDYKDILKEEFQQLLNAKEVVSVKDTVIWDGGKRENYLIVQGQSIDSILGLKAEQRLLAKDIRKLEDVYKKSHSLTDTNTVSLHLDRKIVKRMFDKAKFVNEMMMQAFRENIFDNNEQNLDLIFLDSVIQTEFKEDQLPENYQFVVVNTLGKPIVPTSSITKYNVSIDLKETSSTHLYPSEMFNEKLSLHVYFPLKNSIVIADMWLPLIISFLLVIIIAGLMTYMLSTILSQNKLAVLKSDFISNMTHEFRTPISTISLACQAMGDKDMMGESLDHIQPFVKMISDENARLATLVDGILQSNSIDKGELRLHKEKVLVNEVIYDLAHRAQFRVKNTGGTIIVNMDSELIYIDADRLHFTNVVSNLIDNAIKYSKDVPEVEITVTNKHGKVKIEVHDKGIGIKKEYLDKIYDQLFRIPTGNVHNVKGFGLGLSYVKGICDLHNWKTTVHSKFGEETTFTIEINN